MNRIQMIRMVLFSFIILTLLLFTGYQHFVVPLQQDITTLKKEVEIETERYANIEVIEEKDMSPSELLLKQLQEQLPTESRLEQLIIDLEKAELASNSLILNMSFGVSTFEEVESKEQSNNQSSSSFPTVEKLLVSMSVQSPTHEDLKLFLNELESMDRIIQVENLTFSRNSGQPETSEASPIVCSLQISAFYYPNQDIIGLLDSIE